MKWVTLQSDTSQGTGGTVDEFIENTEPVYSQLEVFPVRLASYKKKAQLKMKHLQLNLPTYF